MNRDLIRYFENVLGVKSFLRLDAVSTKKAWPSIYIEDFKKYSGEERALTEKILAAVGITIDTVHVVENEDIVTLLTFKDQPQKESEIFSPRILLQKPELKKMAWEKLKIQMLSSPSN